MERSGLEYQTLGEPTRSLLEERRGEVVEEDMVMDELMGHGQANPDLLIRLDTSNPRDSPAPYPIGPQFNCDKPSTLDQSSLGASRSPQSLISHPQYEGSRTTHISDGVTHPPHYDVKTSSLCDWVVSGYYSANP